MLIFWLFFKLENKLFEKIASVNTFLVSLGRLRQALIKYCLEKIFSKYRRKNNLVIII
jgi:hypothetical protein